MSFLDDLGPSSPRPRTATLILVTADGDVLGRLPSYPVETPWWQDVGPIVHGARERLGLEITVLRLLETELPAPHGGAVTYLAEVDATDVAGRESEVGLTRWAGRLDDDPRRQAYARPGGPAADLAWAEGVLAARGVARDGPAEQVRTWNLSCLWRLPTGDGAAWLKVVPPFFAHEGALLERLGGGSVPLVLAREGGRMLLAEVVGEDRYEAPLPELLDMVDLLLRLQARWPGMWSEVRSLGLPDWRADPLTTAIADLVERAGGVLGDADRVLLDRFIEGLPARFGALDACGLPDGLVHGDFHPGNVRGDQGSLVLLDWGDSGIGHPLLDQPAFLTRIGAAAVSPVREHWHTAWRRVVPGADPDRAATLLAPIAAARQAVIYQGFLDRIESSEQAYHRSDVPDWLERTCAILRAEY